MSPVDISTILPAIGGFSGAAAIGALLGYGFKKLLRVLLVVLAALTTIIAVPLGYLAYEQVITVDWDRLYGLVVGGITTTSNLAANLIQSTSIGLPIFGGFGAGFAIGFKQG